ncbi:MAG: hypothetical protein K2Y32_19665 [Candidatus Obscuribacterales bacterium]|nr:hypothetical protein [Candidatus Obscuribacterales bacterium]
MNSTKNLPKPGLKPSFQHSFRLSRHPERFFTLATAFSISLIAAQRGQAADWGYEDGAVEKQESQPAIKPANKPVTKAVTMAETSKTSAKASVKTVGQGETKQPNSNKPLNLDKQASLSNQIKLDDKTSWLEIFALVASSEGDDRLAVKSLSTLNYELRGKLEQFLDKRLAEPSLSPLYKNIAPIWAEIRPKVMSQVDYKESYRLLFRALIRHWLLKTQRAQSLDGHSAQALSLESASKEKEPEKQNQEKEKQKTETKIEKGDGYTEDLFADLIGPARVAEPGPPPLTEEAVKAYADMTCFLYSKKHPDKSVDQEDNREIFAGVIRDRFLSAPSEKARFAMCNFDLTWAAFRCKYLDAGAAEKQRLEIYSQDSLTGKELTKLYGMGPWAESNLKKTAPLVKPKAP